MDLHFLGEYDASSLNESIVCADPKGRVSDPLGPHDALRRPLQEGQGRGVEAWLGTLRPRRWELEPVRGALADGRAAFPATDGGGGTGSRGRTPTGAVEATQPLKRSPASIMIGNVTELRMALLHQDRC